MSFDFYYWLSTKEFGDCILLRFNGIWLLFLNKSGINPWYEDDMLSLVLNDSYKIGGILLGITGSEESILLKKLNLY